MRDERGSIASLLLLMLPALLLITALVIDIGTLFCAKAVAYNAADMAALAAVQNLDLTKLAEGTRYVLPEAADVDVRAWLATNTVANWAGVRPEDVAAAVAVYNPDGNQHLSHAGNGRSLGDPTVCVTVSFPVKLRFISFLVPQTRASAHADASVVRKGGP